MKYQVPSPKFSRIVDRVQGFTLDSLFVLDKLETSRGNDRLTFSTSIPDCSRGHVFCFYFLVFIFALSALPFVFNFSIFNFQFSIVDAQIPTSADGIDISVNPPSQAPGKNVDITINDYSSDISSADIIWSLNGKKLTDGIGKSDISLNAPDLGKTDNISVLIQTEAGQNIQKSITLKSGSVDLVWESNGYAPPLYGGKQDFAYENTVKIVAMPHLADNSGVPIDPSTLIYNWQQDSTNLQNQSGYGKQSIMIVGSVIPRSTTISVSVSTRDGKETASNVINLQPGSPSLIFYKDDPLYGVLYNLSLGAQTVFSNQEITLLAAPFSFNMPNNITSLTKNNLQYNWTINGTAQSNLTGNRSVTLRVQDTSSDSNYPVQLQLQNLKQILQGASNAITVMFIAKENNNGISL